MLNFILASRDLISFRVSLFSANFTTKLNLGLLQTPRRSGWEGCLSNIRGWSSRDPQNDQMILRGPSLGMWRLKKCSSWIYRVANGVSCWYRFYCVKISIYLPFFVLIQLKWPLRYAFWLWLWLWLELVIFQCQIKQKAFASQLQGWTQEATFVSQLTMNWIFHQTPSNVVLNLEFDGFCGISSK